MNKPHNLLICRDWPEARNLMSLELWPIRYGNAISINKMQATVTTETDVFHLFWDVEPNILWSMEIKEFYLSDGAVMRPDIKKIIGEAQKRRRIQAIPNYLELLGLAKK